MRRATAALAWALAAATAGGCASDPRITAWVARWRPVEHDLRKAPPEATLAALGALRESAPTPVDRDMIALREAAVLRAEGRGADAFRALEGVAMRGVRREDRGRARLDQARLAEAAGDADAARRLYRRVVLTWPDDMPGLRALAALEREARFGPPAAMAAHLAWTLEVLPRLAHTTLGDNLVYFAAHEARRRWKATGDARWAEVAERLYGELERGFVQAGKWDEGLWELSWLYHAQGRWADEIAAIRRLQATREASWFMGSYEQPEYWLGELRIARLHLTVLGDPAGAARSFAWVAATWPEHILTDDALFYEGCAWLRAGRRDRAEAAFRRIPEAYADSKYLRRLDDARAAPEGPVCLPDALEEPR